MSDAGHPVGLIPFAPHYRASGALVHITSLPSPYGIGDVGPAAFAMVDRLQSAGQSWWQALPLGPTGYGNSPYQCLSSFAGNGLLISPDCLIDEGLLRASDCDEGRSFPKNAVEYEILLDVDSVLIMTVNPGFGHQHFLRTALPKIRRVRQMIEQTNPDCELELDGGIDAATAPLGVAAGANVLVAGSAIFNDGDGVAAAVNRLRAATKLAVN